jgi:hypothetical protein
LGEETEYVSFSSSSWALGRDARTTNKKSSGRSVTVAIVDEKRRSALMGWGRKEEGRRKTRGSRYIDYRRLGVGSRKRWVMEMRSFCGGCLVEGANGTTRLC